MVLAIPGRSVGSYWTPVGGHWEVMRFWLRGDIFGGILETSLVIPGGYLEIYWGYLGNN